MADEILGISGSIDASEINKGANDFLAQISKIERAVESSAENMQNSWNEMSKNLVAEMSRMAGSMSQGSGTAYSITLDTNKLQHATQEVAQDLQTVADSATTTGDKVKTDVGGGFDSAKENAEDFAEKAKNSLEDTDELVKKLTKAASSLGLAFSANALVNKVISIRGEMQQLEVAFNTMLGSAQKADALMQQLVNTAATTPFGLEDVANGAKQLLAYGTASEKVNETLIRLGDIAAGLSIPLNDLVYLYGTTMAQGRLYTQDLNQFTGRGIPMIQELAAQFGVAESQVKDLVTQGKVGFPEVQKVIEDLTKEGGKFGGLMESQSHTITGQISNIQDAIDMMFNDIGQQSEGVINLALEGVSSMVENYERVGRTLAGLVVAYGVYKAGLIVAIATENVAAFTEGLHAKALLFVEAAQKALNATMLKNPYVMVATLIGTLIVALANMKTEQELLNEATENYNTSKQQAIDAEAEHKRKIDELCATVSDESQATELRRQALLELEKQYPTIFARYDTEAEKLAHIADIKREIAQLDGKNSFNEEKWNNERIKELRSKRDQRVEDTNSVTGLSEYSRRGLSAEEDAELKIREKEQSKLSKTNQKKRTDDYFLNLQNVSPEVLKGRQRQLTHAINAAARKGGAKGSAVITDTKLYGTVAYTVDEMQAYLNRVNEEIGVRNGKPKKKQSTGTGTTTDGKKGGKNGGKTTSKATGKTEAEIQAEKEQKAADAAYKAEQESLEKQNQLQSLKDSVEQERINATKNNGEKQLAQLKLNHKKELAELEKEKKDYLKQKVELAKADFQADPNNKNKVFDYSSVKLTEEEENLFTQRRSYILNRQEQERNAPSEAEKKAQQQYLLQYGNFEEKKQAARYIANDAIANATTQGEKNSVTAKLNQDIAAIDFDKLKNDVSWDKVFSGLENIDTSKLDEINEKLKTFYETCQNNPEQAQQVAEAMDKIADIKISRDPFKALKESTAEITAARKKLKEAREGNDSEKELEAMDDLQKATQKNKKALKSITDTTEKFAETLNDLGQSIGGTAGKFLTLTSNILTGCTTIAAGIKAVGTAVSYIEKTVAVLQIISAALQVINAIVSVFSSGPDKTLTQYVDAMNTYTSVLKDTISDLNDEMQEQDKTVKELIDDYDTLLAKYKESNTVIKSQAITWLNSGASTSSRSEGYKIGQAISKGLKSSSTTVQKFYQDGLNQLFEYYRQATGKIATSVSDLGRFDWIWQLPDEALEALSKNSTVMALLGDTMSTYLSNYVSNMKSATDATDTLAESILNISFEDFYSDFSEMVTDLTKSTKSMTNSISKIIRDALLKDLIASSYKSQIQELYNSAYNLATNQKDMTEDEFAQSIAALRNGYSSLGKQIQDSVKVLDTITGYNENWDDQTASAGAFETMSEDTATELSGRFAALQESNEAIRQNSLLALQHMETQVVNVDSIRGYVSEIADIQRTTASNVADIAKMSLLYMPYLEDIKDNTKKLLKAV